MLNLRPIDAKGLTEEVVIMKWNPAMDLLAIVFKSGDITLNRLLSWQKVWRIPFPGNKNRQDKSMDGRSTSSSSVKDIAWRPDGRVLAICYDVDIVDGAVVVDGPPSDKQQRSSVCSLHNVENGEVINTIQLNIGLITSLGWFVRKSTKDKTPHDQRFQTTESILPEKYLAELHQVFSETTDDGVDISKYLPEMHPLPTSFNATNRRNTGYSFVPQANSILQSATQTTSDALSTLLASNQSSLNILAIATDKACIKFYALGLYDVGSFELDVSLIDAPITDIFLSSCMRYISVIQEKPSMNASQSHLEHSRRTNDNSRSSRPKYSPGTSRRSRASTNFETPDMPRSRSSSFNDQNISNISAGRRQLSVASDSPMYKYIYSMCTVEIDTFFRRSNEILRVSKMYAKILSELQYLDEVMKAITGSWEDVLAGLDTKLSNYCSRRAQQQQANVGSALNPNIYTLLTADEFLQLLVIGHLSDNLEKFLHDLSDKGLRKLNQAIEQTCSKVQNLVVRDAQKCCYHLHNDLNTLRGMSKWKDRYGDVGLDEKTIVIAMKSVGSLLLKLTELQQVIDHSLRSAKSFFRWLTSIMNRVSNDSSPNMIPNEVMMTTQQDIQFITDFILENFDYSPDEDTTNTKVGRHDDSFERPTCSNFTLEQVGQYLKDESLTRQKYSFVNPGANFWIDFIKDHPELSEDTSMGEDGTCMLLFYPHNPETSLIQEHNCSDRLVREAFSSVSNNITQTLSNSEMKIELEELVRGTNGIKTTRISVETDTISHQHYCLFMPEDSPSEKLYLMAMSLITNKSRLINLKLIKLDDNIGHDVDAVNETDRKQTGSTESFIVCDFKFFTPTVISFLLMDQERTNTYLVQVHIEQLKMHEATKRTKWWSAKEINEIFTCRDALEQQSEDIQIYIDVNVTSQQRKLNPGIVYRKVRSVLGIDMAVEGKRKVVCFTSDNNKKIHLYDLESCDPEEELEDEERSLDEGDGTIVTLERQ